MMHFCEGVNCGIIAGETAIISLPGTGYDQVARFHCPASYRLSGPSTRKCLQTGQWSGSHPRCTSKLETSNVLKILTNFLDP